MIKNIKEKLTKNPSYLRIGNKRLASKFNCSERTIKRVKNSLKEVKEQYESRFKN